MLKTFVLSEKKVIEPSLPTDMDNIAVADVMLGNISNIDYNTDAAEFFARPLPYHQHKFHLDVRRH